MLSLRGPSHEARVPSRKSPTTRSRRDFWLLSLCAALPLALGAAALVRMEAALARAERSVEAVERLDRPVRAELALADWGQPWLETFARTEGLPEGSTARLESCMRALVVRLDQLSLTSNIVQQNRIEEAQFSAFHCASQTLPGDSAQRFVLQIRERWDAWKAQVGA